MLLFCCCQVKYLGESEAGGLWGIKHTRRPVDLMVRAAKELRAGHVLPLARLTITQNAVILQPIDAKASKGISFNIADISYGVQVLLLLFHIFQKMFHFSPWKDSKVK